MEEVRIWAVNGTSDVVPLEARDRVDTESLLEETLVNNPQLLLTGLRLVGRQTPTEGGPLDLLGVDEDGKLVVFELKRGTLSRDSVAQVIDYASYLEAMDLADLASHISDRSGEHGIEAIEDFQEWYSQYPGGLEGLRPLRMFLVGLGVDDRTERMVSFLANNSGMDISLLTFHGFSYDGKTLLAKQVEVEGTGDTSPHSSKAIPDRGRDQRAVGKAHRRIWCIATIHRCERYVQGELARPQRKHRSVPPSGFISWSRPKKENVRHAHMPASLPIREGSE